MKKKKKKKKKKNTHTQRKKKKCFCLLFSDAVSLCRVSSLRQVSFVGSDKRKKRKTKGKKSCDLFWCVFSRDVTVSFSVFNVGSSAAHDVELTEGGFKSELFASLVGSAKASWKSIAAGANVTHTFVVKPRRATEKTEPFYGYPAVVTYAATLEGPKINAYSNDVGAFHIYQRGELAKKVKSSLKSWIVVFASVAASTGLPLFVWRYYQTNFPNGLPKRG